MKIDRTKVKKSSSEVPADCRNLIDKLKACSQEEFLAELKKIDTWTYGKCELYHWIDILDLCDQILESATKRDPGSWVLECDKEGPEPAKLKELVLWTLHFTTLLIEHSFSRHFYSSMEHLSLLLSSFDLDVVLAVLNLLYMFSKRSNFISRLIPDKRQVLLNRLSYLAASWGGKDNGFGLAKCCADEPIASFPSSATTLHFEFYAEAPTDQARKSAQSSLVTVIHVENVDKLNKSPAVIMEDLLKQYNVPEEKEMLLYTYVRLAHGFSKYPVRLKCVQARLQALSVLIYSNQLTDSIHSLLYTGLLEELVDVLEMKGDHLMEIKAAALKSLTSIIHLDRTPNFPKLNTIIDVTGAASYHGFLPVMVRNCIACLTSPAVAGAEAAASGSADAPAAAAASTLAAANSSSFPQPLATALFSFLYHLASYEAGGEALVNCGMMESLLKVIQWPSSELEHITFVTRAVRVIDLITNLDMISFQTHGGLSIFIARLKQEVDHCRKHQPFEIQAGSKEDQLANAMEHAETLNDPAVLRAQQQLSEDSENQESMEVDPDPQSVASGGSEDHSAHQLADIGDEVSAQCFRSTGLTCLPQRGALLKSMLNFLKKAIQDPTFSDSIRHVMDGSLPSSLKHIISNAEYYGPSLFLLATDVVTAYVFQEPSLLSSLQDKGLTDVVLHALLVKEVPATREVLASLPNVFSALCLNSRGLEAFVACNPFDRLFKVLLSPDYLPAMRRRRSAEPIGDTATNLGNAMDELMRHQPSLKSAATSAIIKLLEQLCELGRDPRYVCWKSSSKTDITTSSGTSTGRRVSGRLADMPVGGSSRVVGAGGVGAEASSDEEEEEDDDGGNQPGGSGAAGEGRDDAVVVVDPESNSQSDTGNGTDATMSATAAGVNEGTADSNPAGDGDDQMGEPGPSSSSGGVIQTAGSSGTTTGGLAAGKSGSSSVNGKEPVPLVDYILNVMKFVDAILSNNSTDDHCREFVSQKGLVPLMGILGLPNLPIDFPTQPACQSVGAVCKSILNLAHEAQVLEQGLLHLNQVLVKLEPMHNPMAPPGSSVLLHELVSAISLAEAINNPAVTPLLHNMCAAHAYISMFVHVCRTGQADIRTISVNHWGSPLGIQVLEGLARLYTSLVWESTVLLAIFSEDSMPEGFQFGRADLEKLLQFQQGGSPRPTGGNTTTQQTAANAAGAAQSGSSTNTASANAQPPQQQNTTDNSPAVSPASGGSIESGSVHVTTAMEHLTTVESSSHANEGNEMEITVGGVEPSNSAAPPSSSASAPMTAESGSSNGGSKQSSGVGPHGLSAAQLQAQIKQIKPLLSGSSRLGRALTELFGLLVKLCVGSPLRQRRGQTVPPAPAMPSLAARNVASALTQLMTSILSWEPPIMSALAKDGASQAAAITPSPLPKFRLTFLICSVGFNTPMLFDDKKYPYHLMLNNFINSGGQKAFFRVFYWAITMGNTVPANEGLERQDLPEGTGEFLDAWLILLEKMVNPKNVLESPHVIPSRPVLSWKPFNALRYLINTHKTAFEAVMHVWGKKPLPVYGGRMAETVLTILCHILKGENMIKEKLEKEKSAPADPFDSSLSLREQFNSLHEQAIRSGRMEQQPRWITGGGGNAAPAENNVNQEHLQTLMDMGFPRESCIEAIQAVGGSLDAATDYLLTNPVPAPQQAAPAAADSGQTSAQSDDLLRAIAMSLGQSVGESSTDQAMPPATGSAPAETAAAPAANDASSTDTNNGAAPGPSSEAEETVDPEEAMSCDEAEALKQQVIDGFTKNALTGCLTLLDTLPETVYRVTDLLIAIFARNGSAFREQLLTELMNEVKLSVTRLLELAHNDEDAGLLELFEGAESRKAAVRIHLFTLLFEDCRGLCVRLVEASETVQNMVRLIAATEWAMTLAGHMVRRAAVGPPITPKWITPMLLFIDLYEKVVLAMKRRSALIDIASNTWKWFEVSSGKWCPYSSTHNAVIDEAFWAGEPSVKITHGRRKYNIQFGQMVQSNEETGNKRPIMLHLKDPKTDKPAADAKTVADAKTSADAKQTDAKQADAKDDETKTEAPEQMETKQSGTGAAEGEKPPLASSSGEKPAVDETERRRKLKEELNCKGLDRTASTILLKACVRMIAIPVEPDALNAIMRLCLRLTRDFELAAQFAEIGGIRLLLDLSQASSFGGFTSLASLLVRHVLEDQYTLRHTMEKVVRASTLSHNTSTTKEFHYLMRYLGPAVCRNPDMFSGVVQDILRVDTSLLGKRGEPEDDPRLLMKSLPAKSCHAPPPLGDVSRVVISDLLDFLAAGTPDDVPAEGAAKQDDTFSLSEGELPVSVASIIAAGNSGRATSAAASNDSTTTSRPTAAQASAGSTNKAGDETKDKDSDLLTRIPPPTGANRRPLLPKSAVCRLLAEMVKSYAVCARLITDHQFAAGMTDLVKEDCSALAFILDELLTLQSDKDCASLVKMLVSAIAGCNHAPEAQTTLVAEVKNALMRALSLPECPDKHTRIQALTGLISTMIDSCPMSPSSSSMHLFKQNQSQGSNMNNIVKCMLRKGLITDLARVPHALDLSSPGMAASVNAALKPLETLSKIVNQPNGLQTTVKPSKSAKSGSGAANTGGADGSGNSATDATARTGDQAGRDSNQSRNGGGSADAGPGDASQNGAMDDPSNINTNTTNSEATHAQGDEVVGGDLEATEHDVSTAASGGDPNSESGALHTVEEGDAEDFEDMMDQLLERDAVGGGSNGPVPPVIIADVSNMNRSDRTMDTEDSVLEDNREMAGDTTEVISEVISDSDSSHSHDDEEDDGEDMEEDEEAVDDEEEYEEEEDEDDDDEEDEEDEDDDGGSEVYEDEPDEYPDLVPPGLERDFDPVMMIGLHDDSDTLFEEGLMRVEMLAGGGPSSLFTANGTGNGLMGHGAAGGGLAGGFGGAAGAPLALWGELGFGNDGQSGAAGGAGDDAGNAAAGGSGASGSGVGASGHVTPSHPLLMGRSGGLGLGAGVLGDAAGGVGGVGAARGAQLPSVRTLQRHRGFRYISLNTRNGVGGGASSGAPAVLQSLLGSNSARDFFTFAGGAGGQGGGSSFRDARLLVLDNALAIFDGLDDDQLNGIGGMESSLLTSSIMSSLNTVPNALVRWKEESRVLDGDSVHDCVTAIKPAVLEVIERHRDEEFAERREKRRKQQEAEAAEEAAKRKKEESETAATAQVDDGKQLAAGPTTVGESSTIQVPAGDTTNEMDVVVSENSAITTAVDSIVASGGQIQGVAAASSSSSSSSTVGLEADPTSSSTISAPSSTAPRNVFTRTASSATFTNTMSRLTEDLASAIHSRVTAIPGLTSGHQQSGAATSTGGPEGSVAPAAGALPTFDMNADHAASFQQLGLPPGVMASVSSGVFRIPSLTDLLLGPQADGGADPTVPGAVVATSDAAAGAAATSVSQSYPQSMPGSNTINSVLQSLSASSQASSRPPSNDITSGAEAVSAPRPQNPIGDITAEASAVVRPERNVDVPSTGWVPATVATSTVSHQQPGPPVFHFATPPSLFPLLPIPTSTNVRIPGPTASLSGNGGHAGPASLPDMIGPLSPSPDNESANASAQMPAMVMVNPAASNYAETAVGLNSADVSMTSEPDNSAEIAQQSISNGTAATSQSMDAAAGGESGSGESGQDGAAAAPEPGPSSSVEGGSSSTNNDPSQPDFSAILGDIEIPEGVDPSFLAALPEDMRQEVLEEQRRLARARQQSATAAAAAASGASGTLASQGVSEVNPEFLAALPPNIQEEVLAQQRLEQQRQNAARADPSAPVDPGEFLQNLPPSLRQSLLADMEDSQISALPAELAAEAQSLRRDYEQRNRAMMHERFFNHVNSHAGPTLSSILRNTVNRIGGHGHMAIHPGGSGGGAGNHYRVWTRSIGRGGPGHQHNAAVIAAANNIKFKGRQLLDNEALSCLLILLFIDDAKLNTTRLHRILRNLCYHAPTRDWVIKCLLSILEKANASGNADSPNAGPNSLMMGADIMSGAVAPPPAKLRKSVTGGSSSSGGAASRVSEPRLSASSGPTITNCGQNTWLNISMDAALGFRANVFQVVRPAHPVTPSGGKKSSSAAAHVIHSSSIHVHPQAAPVVCKHTLELLISLAKSFPIHFLPLTGSASQPAGDAVLAIAGPSSSSSGESSKQRQSSSSATASSTANHRQEFWETLLKLDRESWSGKGGAGGKGKSIARSHSTATSGSCSSITDEDGGSGANGSQSGSAAANAPSAFGQLLSMLACPVIKRSSLLTDKLLRLLSLISLAGQPEVLKRIGDDGFPLVSGDPQSAPSASQQAANNAIDRMVRDEHVQLAVEVLTSKACSEEGLEDVTALLLNLSYGGATTRDTILRQLLAGARELGRVVCGHVSELLNELAELKANGSIAAGEGQSSDGSEESRPKGVLCDRFTKEAVVLTAPVKPKSGSGGGAELQLSSMSALTNKTSSQSFFLRVLKVIIQLREAALLAMKSEELKAKKEAAEARLAAATSSAAAPQEGATPSAGDQPVPMEQSATDEAKEPTAAEQTSQTESAAGSSGSSEIPMDVDESTHSQDTNSKPKGSEDSVGASLESLSEQLSLTDLWGALSNCLKELADTPDHHAVLVLQPTVEAFFLVHAAVTSNEEKKKPNQKETRQEQLAHIQEDKLGEDGKTAPSSTEAVPLSPDTVKFLEFAETHRTVLNQILRQSTIHLADGPFSVLVDHTRVLDFDIKRRYFRTELERMDEGMRREDLAVHVRREAVFEESFRELHRRSAEEWKNRFYIVFEGEEGQDAGGLLREWYVIISREIFNPNYALFKCSAGDRVTYTINDFSHINSNHLDYFKFVGRVIAKAIYDNKLLECYFTRSFYKHILAKPVKHQDMESEDYDFSKGLAFLVENKVVDLGYDLTFSTEIQEFGVTEVRDLIPNGRNITVNEENKLDYVRLVCQMKMTGAIRKQLSAFLEGFYDIIPRRLISIFNEQELELLLSGLPDINIDDLKANSEYHKYTATSLQIVWFWRALRSFDQTDRAKFLQFVTGSSKVPLQGFGALEGMNGPQKFQIHRDDRSTDRLPAAHTCFNQLDLPAYETYDKLRKYLMKAIHECSEGFGFA